MHHLSLCDSEVVENPYPYYRWLRQNQPIHWSSVVDAWLIARWKDVTTALRDDRLSVRDNRRYFDRLPADTLRKLEPLQRFFEAWMGATDGERHAEIREPWRKAFIGRAVEPIAENIEEIVDHLLNKAQVVGELDVLQDMSKLPFLALLKLVGIGLRDVHQLRGWVQDIVTFMRAPDEQSAFRALRSMEQWRAKVAGLLQERRAGDGADLLSLLAFQLDQDLVDEEYLFANVASLFVGQNEPTINMIANGLYTLLHNPAPLAVLRESPGLARAIVNEIARVEPPFQFVTRSALCDLDISGQKIHKGQRVLLLLASANRDEEEFSDADAIKPERPEQRHLSFGLGSHYCLGTSLAQLEIELALTRIVRRFPNLQISNRPRWRSELGFRGLEALTLKLGEDEKWAKVAVSRG